MFSRLRRNIVVLWIVRLLALPVIVLLYAAGFVLNLLYGICGSIGMVLAGLGGFAAFLALLDGSMHRRQLRRLWRCCYAHLQHRCCYHWREVP